MGFLLGLCCVPYGCYWANSASQCFLVSNVGFHVVNVVYLFTTEKCEASIKRNGLVPILAI